jgi:methionyl-tRNA formyltransferase
VVNSLKSDISAVFFGSGPVAAASLRFLKDVFHIEAVVTKPATKDEMASAAPDTPMHTVANKQELTNLIATQPFISQLGFIVDFGIIVQRQVIDYFPLGIINSHFSLLPRWRGADPISFSILEGDEKTGVSLMLIDQQLDTGKLIAQKSLPIKPDETTPSLTQKLIDLSNHMLVEYVPAYVSGQVKPRVQPHPSRATYSRKLTKEDGVIDWLKPASGLEREVRAFLDWPKSRTVLGGREVIVTKAHAVPVDGKPGQVEIIDTTALAVYCGKGYLCIDRLKPAGKNEMPIAAFLAGYKKYFAEN